MNKYMSIVPILSIAAVPPREDPPGQPPFYFLFYFVIFYLRFYSVDVSFCRMFYVYCCIVTCMSLSFVRETPGLVRAYPECKKGKETKEQRVES